MKWFDVDKAGLAAILERRGKAFAIFEPVSNAWDSGPTQVNIMLAANPGSPTANLVVEDNSTEGWDNLDDAFTIFGRSRRGGEAEKRGRFGFGEKLVLAISASAKLETMAGTVIFDADGGRRNSSAKMERGTRLTAVIRCTRDELSEIEAAAERLIPPVVTTFNGETINAPKLLKKFSAKLPTEIKDADGNLRRTVRITTVEAYAAEPGDGDILEMGIPVCAADWPWRLNVMQKIPLSIERESVTDAFRRALQVAAVNAMADTLTEEEAAKPFVSEAIGDSRISPEALQQVIKDRFGDRAVVAVPGDPIANATAEAAGCQVIHGGALPGDAWANIRKHSMIPSTSQAFPTPRPADKGGAPSICPLCKQPVAR